MHFVSHLPGEGMFRSHAEALQSLARAFLLVALGVAALGLVF